MSYAATRGSVLPIRNAAHVSWTRRHRTLRANHGRRRGKVASLRDAAGAALSSSAASPRFPFYNEDDRVFDWPSLEEGLDVKDAGFEGPAAAERARQTLERIARFAGARSTDGIGADHRWAALRRDPLLVRTVEEAGEMHDSLVDSDGLCGGKCYAELLRLDEPDLCTRLRVDVLNFYPAAGCQPFVPLAANGPWIITTHGAVIYDTAGYGMTGFGHNPESLLEAVGKSEAMANVMTASFAQAELTHALRREIGRNWRGPSGTGGSGAGGVFGEGYLRAKTSLSGGEEEDAEVEEVERAWNAAQLEHTPPPEPPYEAFACLNSGSEAVGLALRVTDAAARAAVDGRTCGGGRLAKHAGKTPVLMSLVGSFHGRTDRAAQVSYATGDTYRAALATWLPRAAAAAPAAVPDDLPSETQPRRAPFDVDDFFRDPDNLERPFDVDDFFRDVENIKSERNNVVEREVDDAIPWDDASPAPPQRAAAEAPNPPCVFVQPNDVEDLRAAFRRCDAEGFFVEAMLIEPCMGEGDPGRLVTRESYDEARRLTASHGSMLIVDSVQAGLRATGELSLLDYPGFETCEPPDFEVFSKALNGGQFPLSVIAFSGAAAEAYRVGIYGNTMAFNPRASRVGAAALGSMTPSLRRNIVERGEDLVAELEKLVARHPDSLERVLGSGLLTGLHVNPRVRVTGVGGLEERCRKLGLNVVHGGVNALRFTPWFHVTAHEIDLVVDVVEQALTEYLRDEAEGEVEDKVTSPSSAAFIPTLRLTRANFISAGEVEKREDAVGYVRKIPALAALKNNVLASGAMRQAADDWMEKKIEVARLVVDAVMDSYLARNPKSARAVAAIVAEAESKNSSPANIPAGGDAVSEEEEAPISSRVPLDHIGFRTFDVDGMGIESVANLFESLGYVEAAGEQLGDGPLTFPAKKVHARWFRPPPASPPLPRVFISEIRVDELSPQARSIIRSYVGATSASAVSMSGTEQGSHGVPLLFSTDPASAAMPYNCLTTAEKRHDDHAEKKHAGCHLRYPGAFAAPGFTSQRFACVLNVIQEVYAVAGDLAAGAANHMCCGGVLGGAPWDSSAVSTEEYEALAAESEYAAWTLMNGYALNHAAVAVHRLVPSAVNVISSPDVHATGLNTLVGVNEFVSSSFELCKVSRPSAGAAAAAADRFSEDAFSRISPDGGLRQSSTAADLIERALFSEVEGEFRTMQIPAGYLEFVERRSLVGGVGALWSPSELCAEYLLRDGFCEGNADKIFESTFDKNTNARTNSSKTSTEMELRYSAGDLRLYYSRITNNKTSTEMNKSAEQVMLNQIKKSTEKKKVQLRKELEGNNDPGLLLSAEIDGKIQMLQSSVQFTGGVRHNIVSRAGGKFCVYPRLPRHPRGKARRKQSVRRGDGASSAAAVHEDMWADGDLFVGAY